MGETAWGVGCKCHQQSLNFPHWPLSGVANCEVQQATSALEPQNTVSDQQTLLGAMQLLRGPVRLCLP
jgi:hypothetical protein